MSSMRAYGGQVWGTSGAFGGFSASCGGLTVSYACTTLTAGGFAFLSGTGESVGQPGAASIGECRPGIPGNAALKRAPRFFADSATPRAGGSEAVAFMPRQARRDGVEAPTGRD